MAKIFSKLVVLMVLAGFISASLPLEASGIDMAAPSVASGQAMDGNYRLSKYDVLNIVIIGFSSNDTNATSSNKDMSGFSDIVIGPDGYVNLPYAGSVKLVGLTLEEANTLLEEKLGQYIRIPGMAIMVKQYGPRKVYVMGEVTKAGIYDLSSEYMNVFAAISSAGGITHKGRPKHIAVVRLVDGKMVMQEVNFDRFIEKHDASQNVKLLDGDMVYVPKSNKISLSEDIMPLAYSWYYVHSLTD